MIKTQSTLRAWGNSIGIVLPKEELRADSLGVNDEVEVIIKKKTNPLREIFGKLKFKTPTDQLLRQVDKDMESKY